MELNFRVLANDEKNLKLDNEHLTSAKFTSFGF